MQLALPLSDCQVAIASNCRLTYGPGPMHSRKSRRLETLMGLESRAVAAGIVSFLFCAPLKASTLVELQLDAPHECPSRSAIETALNRLVQRPPLAPLRVSARLAPDANRWVLYAVFENGQRVIPGDSCLAVAEALVVLLALAIDPSASLQSADFSELQQGNAPLPAIPNANGSVEPPSNLPATHPHGSVPQRQKQQYRFGMSFLMLAETGSLPSASLGPALFVRYGSRSYWGESSASGLYPKFVAASTQDQNKGGRVGWFAGQLAGCAAPVETLPLAGCLGAELGDMFGYGVGVGQERTAFTPWFAATASAVLRPELRGDWGVELRLGAAVPFLHPDFGLRGYGAFFHPDWVSFRAMAGFSWR